jgi:hypothetical protein
MVMSASALAEQQADKLRSLVPVDDWVSALLPDGGLRRGSTVVVRGSNTLLLTLLAKATSIGAWAAAVGLPDLGLLAGHELGIGLNRFALIPKPGPALADVLAALIDGFTLVAVDTATVLSSRNGPNLARRLSARAREREAVLLPVGAEQWPAADLDLRCESTNWTGLGHGYGCLGARELVVVTQGQGAAGRPRQGSVVLPGDPIVDTWQDAVSRRQRSRPLTVADYALLQRA